MEDDDFILRQIKSFAEGFGAILGKGKEKNEVVFEQQQNQKGKIYTNLDRLLLHRKYEEAIHYVYAQKFELDGDIYYRLGIWLYGKLDGVSGVDPGLLEEFLGQIEKNNK